MEKCTDLELDIEFAEERKQKAEEKIAVLRTIERKIRTNLLDLGQNLLWTRRFIIYFALS